MGVLCRDQHMMGPLEGVTWIGSFDGPSERVPWRYRLQGSPGRSPSWVVCMCILQ
jgi:hypothetical protein